MEIFILPGVCETIAKRVSDPRIKNSRYHAMNFKTINSVAMIYILPATVKGFWYVGPSKWDVLIYLSKYFSHGQRQTAITFLYKEFFIIRKCHRAIVAIALDESATYLFKVLYLLTCLCSF